MLRVAFYRTKAQDEALREKEHQKIKAELAAASAVPIPPTGHPVYDWQPGMREISGFGGLYEGACRKMVAAGCAWFDEHPEADPQFHGYQGVYGILAEDNDDARNLTKCLIAACPDGGPSGAMLQATTNACLFVRGHGWNEYVQQMSQDAEAA